VPVLPLVILVDLSTLSGMFNSLYQLYLTDIGVHFCSAFSDVVQYQVFGYIVLFFIKIIGYTWLSCVVDIKLHHVVHRIAVSGFKFLFAV